MVCLNDVQIRPMIRLTVRPCEDLHHVHHVHHPGMEGNGCHRNRPSLKLLEKVAAELDEENGCLWVSDNMSITRDDRIIAIKISAAVVSWNDRSPCSPNWS
jgi:hypothetical protein